ncbi:MAG: transcriptional regulator NrdR [Pseudomonadota bacterium]|nr:transcriptional regulator NrdR [Pseudomonadota bacterium]
MRCPFCVCEDTRVVDSRLGDGGESVRRRRECQACKERFTTYERVELRLPQVIKSDGGRERFDEEKLRRGIARALEKRPIDTESVEAAVSRLLRRFSLVGEREVASREIGEAVMEQLRQLDDVAYVRFASVYRSFQDLDAFSQELQRLRDTPAEDGVEEADEQNR